MARNNLDFQSSKLDFDKLKEVYFIKPEAMEPRDTNSTDNLTGLFHQFKMKLDEPSNNAERGLKAIMARLRQEKTPEELQLLRKAISITCEAQK